MASSVTAVNQQDCQHCLCHQDTAGNWVCCKCGYVSRPTIITIVYYPIVVTGGAPWPTPMTTTSP